MIVVLGRPVLDERGALTGPAGAIAAAAAGSGARVEVVGRVVDDGSGDSVIVELGRAGIGHAAVLRDPSAAARALDAADIELGLGYLSDCRVLVVADSLTPDALTAVVAGARYHGAQLVVAKPAGWDVPVAALPEEATLLEAPDAEGEAAFAALVGRYAAHLESGRGAAEAWHDALTETGWESSGHA